jgi:tRNA 2-thiouridine synthesizing protein D
MANFLFVLSRDDNDAATRCFQLAKIAHSKGHKTDLFFVDGAKFFSNMVLDGGPHLIDMAAEAKVFNF